MGDYSTIEELIKIIEPIQNDNGFCDWCQSSKPKKTFDDATASIW
jgi:hypothetical protein